MANKQIKKAVEELQKAAEMTSKVRLAFDLLTQTIEEANRSMRRIAECLEAEYMRKQS